MHRDQACRKQIVCMQKKTQIVNALLCFVTVFSCVVDFDAAHSTTHEQTNVEKWHFDLEIVRNGRSVMVERRPRSVDVFGYDSIHARKKDCDFSKFPMQFISWAMAETHNPPIHQSNIFADNSNWALGSCDHGYNRICCWATLLRLNEHEPKRNCYTHNIYVSKLWVALSAAMMHVCSARIKRIGYIAIWSRWIHTYMVKT